MASYAVSADSHIIEPKEVFDLLERKYGERAPRIIQDPEWGDFVATPQVLAGQRFGAQPGVPVGRLGIAGARLDNPETQRRIRSGYAGLNPGCMDPLARIKEQDQDGVRCEVLYPSLYFRVFGLPDFPVLEDAFRAYNDWLSNYCSQAPDRLVGMAVIPMHDPKAAAVELDRAMKMGFRGISIACTAPGDKPYHDPVYHPIWARAEEAGCVVGLHIFTGAHQGVTGLHNLEPIITYASAATIIQITISDLICQGVAHRFPKLKFVCAEWNTGWLGHWLERLDHAFYRARQSAPAELDLLPSEYWRRQFYATYEDDLNGVLTRESIGVNTLMWGNDYPHHDSIWPNSQRILDDIFQGVPEADRYAMTVGNVTELYGLNVPAMQT